MKFRLIITILLLLFVLTFTLQNSEMVEIKVLLWHVEMPRSIMIFLTLLIGFTIGWFTKAMARIAREQSE